MRQEMITRRLLYIGIIALGILAGIVILKPKMSHQPTPPTATAGDGKHIIDRAGIIPLSDIPRFEQYMDWIMVESGVDIRFVFLTDTGDESIEMLAADIMDQLNIGRRTGKERGLLLLCDMTGQRLKIEVGYGLEGWFTDAFVGYLVNDHARIFFSSGRVSMGLRLMLRLLQHRIREAVIGNEFDPRVLSLVQPLAHLSGGAGVSAKSDFGNGLNTAPEPIDVDSMAFPAGQTPEETYATYITWLSHWPVSPRVDLFTPSSRQYMEAFNTSPAYASFILMGEYGKPFTLVKRDDLALLYFTGTPFVSPHFFVRQEGRWRMDLMAEVRNTREHVGGHLTWSYIGTNDPFSTTFDDLLVAIKGYRRFQDGDNRELTIRGR